MSTQNPVPVTPKGKSTYYRLLRAARTVAINAEGVIEINAIAREAEVVPSLINRYFGSKAGLVCALIEDLYDRFIQQVFEQFEGEGSWREKERQRLEAGVRFHYNEPLSIVLYRQLSMEPEVAQTQTKRVTLIIERAARSIRKAQKKGELPPGPDPGLAAAAMFGAMREVMSEALSRSNPPSQKRVVNMLWQQICAAVSIQPN